MPRWSQIWSEDQFALIWKSECRAIKATAKVEQQQRNADERARKKTREAALNFSVHDPAFLQCVADVREFLQTQECEGDTASTADIRILQELNDLHEVRRYQY